MSLKSWQQEFYSQEASSLVNESDEDCLIHSIKKWTGALPENLEKHEVIYRDHNLLALVTDMKSVSFSGLTCALCQKYSDSSPDEDDFDCYHEGIDEYCPIVRVTGATCSDAYDEGRHDVKPMIALLLDVQEKLKS